MSFIGSSTGIGFKAGHFLVNDEECTRISATVPQNHAKAITTADGSKIVPAGVIIDGVGILYEDIDVTKGDAPGSVVTAGTVYADKVDGTPSFDGITVVTSNTITRPDFEEKITQGQSTEG